MTTVLRIFKLSQSQLSKAVKLKKCEQNKLQKYWHYSIWVIRKFSCHISQKLTNIQQKMNLNSVTMVISRLLVSGRDARWWISSQKVSKLRIIGETYVLSYFNILYMLLLLNKQCDFLSWKAFLLRRISISRTLSIFNIQNQMMLLAAANFRPEQRYSKKPWTSFSSKENSERRNIEAAATSFRMCGPMCGDECTQQDKGVSGLIYYNNKRLGHLYRVEFSSESPSTT